MIIFITTNNNNNKFNGHPIRQDFKPLTSASEAIAVIVIFHVAGAVKTSVVVGADGVRVTRLLQALVDVWVKRSKWRG